MDPATRFPRLERYLANLPAGLDSYPDVRCRASVYRIFSDPVDLATFPFERVPASVARLLREPFLHDGWLPEPLVMATILAVTDFLGFDDAAAASWMHESNGRLVGGRMYRALMSLATPSILVAMAPRQWGVFHRGTKLSAVRGKPTRVRLEYPAHLYERLLVGATGSGILHALALSRARDPIVEVEEHGPTVTVYRVDWS